jgi:hypothetical protein
LPSTPELAVFHTRLGLSVIDATMIHRRAARGEAHDLIERTIRRGDGYAAREMLAHTGCAELLTDTQIRLLTRIVSDSGLNRNTTPDELWAGVAIAEQAIFQTLRRRLGDEAILG